MNHASNIAFLCTALRNLSQINGYEVSNRIEEIRELLDVELGNMRKEQQPAPTSTKPQTDDEIPF